jgi:chromosomal replication initiator protein
LARGEREGISPLLVHGPSGVGKSRLLAGLVVEWIRRHPGSTVAHLTATVFAAGCLEAASQPERDGWSELRARYRAVDLLVLEDLEDLERSPIARNELVHTLDALEALGSSIAVSARTAPGHWQRPTWPARLVNRLIGGLAVHIDPPGELSRRRYILEQARGLGLAISAEAVESLAGTADGYRTLDGWLARLALEARAGSGLHSRGRSAGRAPSALDASTVSAILGEETDLASATWTIETIARAIAARFGVRLSALRGPTRQASVVEARHLAMHLARLHTGLSFAAIGAYFGGRDPATVRHACKSAAQRIATDPALAAAARLGRIEG